MRKKRCTKCGKSKSLKKFYRSEKGLYGRNSACKDCHSNYARPIRRLFKQNFNILKLGEDKIKEIMSLVGKKDENGCKLWLGKLQHKYNYGVFSIKGVLFKAHRLVWMIKNQTNLPSDILILHSCDNPPCCNPKHLRPGNDQDNNDDKIKRGRMAVGEEVHNSKFTEKDIKRMLILRKHGKTYREIGEIFNTQLSYVWKIINKRQWNHVK